MLIEQRSQLRFNLIATQDWQQALLYLKERKCQLLTMLNQAAKRDEFLIPHLNQAIAQFSEKDHNATFQYITQLNKQKQTDYSLIIKGVSFFHSSSLF